MLLLLGFRPADLGQTRHVVYTALIDSIADPGVKRFELVRVGAYSRHERCNQGYTSCIDLSALLAAVPRDREWVRMVKR